MVSVKFIKPWSAYSPGDIAGFDEKRAQSLVDIGAARLHDAAAATPPVAEPVEPDQELEQPAPVADDQVSPEVKPGRTKK